MEQQQRIEVRGWVTGDAEAKETVAGDVVARVNVSAKDVKDKDGHAVASPEKFYTGVFWGEKAREHAAVAKKGAEVKITGTLIHSEYTAKDGTKRRAAEIHYAGMELCKEAPDRVDVKGTVTEDPQLKETGSGKVFARVNVATRSAQRNGQDVPGERFYTGIFWGDAAVDCVDRLQKGSEVKISGELVNRVYEGKDGGGQKVAAEIHRPSMEVLGRGKDLAGPSRGPQGDDLSR